MVADVFFGIVKKSVALFFFVCYNIENSLYGCCTIYNKIRRILRMKKSKTAKVTLALAAFIGSAFCFSGCEVMGMDVDQLLEQAQEFKETIETLQSMDSQIQEYVDSLEENLKAMQQTVEEASTKLAEMQQEVADAEAKLADVQKQLQEANDRIAALEKAGESAE